MVWRKWLVRGLVFSSLGAIVLGGLAFQAWTNPAATRRQVLEKLAEKFSGAVVSVESAQLSLFGHIAVSELRLARRDDLDRTDFLYAPTVLIYHDKEQLLDGHLAIRQVELRRPRLRIIRNHDGTLNLHGVLAAPDLTERVPLIVLEQATILVEDRAGPVPGPVLEIGDVNLTVVNDPLPVLHVEGSGQTDVVGPVRLSARLHRADGDSAATVEASAVPVGPMLLQRLGMVAPRLAGQAHGLSGLGRITAKLARPGSGALSYDVSAALRGGALADPRLPLPLEQIEATARIHDGRVAQAHLAARSGKATLDLDLRDTVLPGAEPVSPEDLLGELDARVEHLPVDGALLARLPPEVQQLQQDFKPLGPVTLTHTFRREAPGRWRKHWVFHPEEMSAEFHKFPYPVHKITGSIEHEAGSDQRHALTLNLAGLAGARPVRLMGRVEGRKPREKFEIDIWADDVPIDDVLLGALPAKSRALAERFHLAGRTDIKAQVRRPAGRHDFENRFFLRFHDACARFDQFPYPLEKVSGVLDILPDHWECKDFRGTHKGGEVRVFGKSVPLPPEPGEPGAGRDNPAATGSPPSCVQVAIQGSNILLDDEFEDALAPPEAPNRAPLQKAWRMMALAGRLNFAADVVDRPNQPQDIEVGVSLSGCAMQPRFFPYLLQDVSGTVQYARDQVRISNVKARHGTSVLGLGEGRVLLKPGGGFQARLGDERPASHVTGNPLVPTQDFLKALPPGLRRGLEPLRLRDPIAVDTRLIVDVSPEVGALPRVWWDGKLTLHNTSLRTGMELTGVEGEVAACGEHNGRGLEGVVGNFDLRRATLLGQPLTNLHGALQVAPDSPEVLRLRNLGADWCGGKVGGEGWIDFKERLRYDMDLKAAQVRLEQFARQNMGSNTDVQGAASAAVHLHGEGAGLDELKGFGRVDVPTGKLYRLPLLLDLVKAFGLRVPDRTAFEQASMTFKIDGPQLEIQELNLFGNAFSLRGRGTLNLDGSDLNLDFHADWARLMQVLPPGLNDLPRAVSNGLFKIRVRGRVGDVRLEKEVVPGVTEPIMRALGKE